MPTISLHDLRHTHATILLKSGVAVKIVSERLGHASPAFTMSVYQHVLPGMQAEAAALFADIINQERAKLAKADQQSEASEDSDDEDRGDDEGGADLAVEGDVEGEAA